MRVDGGMMSEEEKWVGQCTGMVRKKERKLYNGG